MKRAVSCRLELSAAGPAELVLGISVARGHPLAGETLAGRRGVCRDVALDDQARLTQLR